MIDRIKNSLRKIKVYLSLSASRKTRRKLLTFPKNERSKTARFEEYFHFERISKDFRLIIKENVHFKRHCHLLMHPAAEVIIRKNVFFNNYCSLNCLEKIEIGENSILGENVKIYDHNHQYTTSNQTLLVERNLYQTAPVIIGNNCWIGSNVTILKGVTIGNNVIVGANSLIHKSIPANSVVRNNAEQIISTI